jgi:hypothetical protein
MRELLVLDLKVEETLKISKEIEDSLAGDWVFFDVTDGTKAFAIFALKENQSAKLQNSVYEKGLLQANDKFLEYLLGLFTPETKTELSVVKHNNFKDFCFDLNNILNNKKRVYDLSRKDLWIWHEPNDNNFLKMGEKLKDFLEIT